MSRFIFCAALVNSQLWTAALLLSTKPAMAGFCFAFGAVWLFFAGYFFFASKEPTNDR